MTEKGFSKRLSELRENKGVSARDMSISIGQNPGYISNIETGKALPSLTGFFRICEYLEVSPSEFFDSNLTDPAKTDAMFEKLKGLDKKYIDVIQTLIRIFDEK